MQPIRRQDIQGRKVIIKKAMEFCTNAKNMNAGNKQQECSNIPLHRNDIILTILSQMILNSLMELGNLGGSII
jgi:hypothetical protein